MLIFTCLSTPYLISFESDSVGWRVINYSIDACFLVDICFSFNQAYYDEDFVIIEDRKIIGCNYIKGWFSIDLIAIIPLDLIIVPAEGESDT